mgnify:CR=1 FL=1
MHPDGVILSTLSSYVLVSVDLGRCILFIL